MKNLKLFESSDTWVKFRKFLSEKDFELYDGEEDLYNKFIEVINNNELIGEDKTSEITSYLEDKWGLYDGYQEVWNYLNQLLNDIPNKEKINESLPRQKSVDQLKALRKLTKGVDIGDRIPDLMKQGANIHYSRNVIDSGIESYEDYEKKNKSFVSSWNLKNLMGPFNKNKVNEMKYLKTFESYNREPVNHKLAEEMAREILPILQKRREDGESVTISDFDKYMDEKEIESGLSDSIMHNLVDLGFDFDIEKDDDSEGLDFTLITNEN